MDTIKSQWGDAAKTYVYTQEASENAGFNKAVVKERFRDLSGLEFLDAGCGYGVFTDYSARAGADIVGCDGSDRLLKIAEKRYPGRKFQEVDLQKKLPYCDCQFDLVFCNQVLMDIPEIEGLFYEFSRITKEGGILYFAIVHPATYPGKWTEDENGCKISKAIRNYSAIYQMEHEFCGKTTHFHRPISYYLNLAAKNHFCLTHLEEPCACDSPGNLSGLPLFLFAEFQKHMLPQYW